MRIGCTAERTPARSVRRRSTVVVGDYDITNAGKDYRHNDFHIIPRGVIRQMSILRRPELVSLEVEAAS